MHDPWLRQTRRRQILQHPEERLGGLFRIGVAHQFPEALCRGHRYEAVSPFLSLAQVVAVPEAALGSRVHVFVVLFQVSEQNTNKQHHREPFPFQDRALAHRVRGC